MMTRGLMYQFLAASFSLCAVFLADCSIWNNPDLYASADERARTLTTPAIAIAPGPDYLPNLYKSTATVTATITQPALDGVEIEYRDWGTPAWQATTATSWVLTFSNPTPTWTFPHPVSISAYRRHREYRDSGTVYAGLTFVATGSILAFAGQGTAGYSGDGALACWSTLNRPTSLCGDSSALYIADSGNSCIRKVDTSGYISTFVGASGTSAAVTADLSSSLALCSDGTTLYILDCGNSRILQVSGATATELDLSTSGFSLSSPASIAVNDAGTILYIGDKGATTGRILAVSVSGTSVTAVAPLTLSTALSTTAPGGLCFDKQDKVLYIADTGGNRIFSYTVSTTAMAPFAGTGAAGFSGDGGSATLAALDGPTGLSYLNSAGLYIADTGNHRVREVKAGKISTFAGTGMGTEVDGDGVTITMDGNNSPATGAVLYKPQGVFISTKDVYIADTGNHCIRRVISF